MRLIQSAEIWTAGPAVVAAMIGGLALALTAVLILTADDPSDGQLRAEHELPLSSGQRISQTFSILTNGLASVMLRAGTVEPMDGLDTALVVTLRLDGATSGRDAGSDAGEVGRWRLAASDLRAYEWHTLALPSPSTLEAGRVVVLEAWEEEPQSMALQRKGTPPRKRVSMWTSIGDAYPAGDLYLDGKRQTGDLAFRVDYQPGRGAKLRWLLRTTGFSPPVAAVLLYGVFASGLAALYAFGRSMVVHQ